MTERTLNEFLVLAVPISVDPPQSIASHGLKLGRKDGTDDSVIVVGYYLGSGKADS